jgi:hypothetical protein
LSKHPNAQLAQDAMNNAIARHKPNTSNLMFHSDQGTQYSSKAFIDYSGEPEKLILVNPNIKITVRNTLINISVLISSVFILITPL